MKSFEHGMLHETLISHSLLKSVRALGEHQGRQGLYAQQSPEVLETLRKVALVQSVESSNRIEGITAPHERIGSLVSRKSKPADRSEQEIAGYRDVLAEIHAIHARLRLSTRLIQDWHKAIYRYTDEKAGAWKVRDNAILEVRLDGRPTVRFRPVSALSTPEYMDRLVNGFSGDLQEGKAEPLLLIASFVLDFECVHPFADGNGRLGRLLSLLLLYQAGYEVGRWVSLERIVEESKETYYDALLKSSRKWHDGEHDLRPWWGYFIGMLIAAYKEFESRVGTITSAKGAKREMVQQAVERLPARFMIADLKRACPGVSYPTLQRALGELKRQRKVKCLGRGPDAQWERSDA